MAFTDLPQELIYMVLSQSSITENDIEPFLKCKRTSTAAYRSLYSDRSIHITCLSEHVNMDDHYDFGLYGRTLCTETNALRCHLRHCLKPAGTKLLTLKRAAKITLNMRFDEDLTPVLVENLALLASHLVYSSPKDLHLHVTLAYEDNALTDSVIEALLCFASLASCTTHLKLCLRSHHLPFFAAKASNLHLSTLNIRSHSTEPELKEQVFFDVSELEKLKIHTNYAIPSLSFTGCENSKLSALELQLPILTNSTWIQENQLRHITSLQDLRLFTIKDCQALHALFSSTFTFPHLLNLYISFTELVYDIDLFDFDKLAPSLAFLFIQDRRTSKTSNKVCKYTV